MQTDERAWLLNVIRQIADQEPLTSQGHLARVALVQHATLFGPKDPDPSWNAREQIDPAVGNIATTDDATGHG